MKLSLNFNPLQTKLPQILELGLGELNAIPQEGFSGMAEVLEFLANLPTAEAIIALRPSESLQAQTSPSRHPNRSKSKALVGFYAFWRNSIRPNRNAGSNSVSHSPVS
jgi:hypothetical protein